MAEAALLGGLAPDAPGLAFLGMQYQYRMGSALLGGVGEDAAYVVLHTLDQAAKQWRAAITKSAMLHLSTVTRYQHHGLRGRTRSASSPPPSALRNVTLPPCARAMVRAIARPRPLPPVSRLRDASSR